MPDSFTCAPLTPARLDAAESVFKGCGNDGKCWCAYWYRPAADFKAGWGDGNRSFFRSLVRAGPPPGIVAYRDGEPVGWCGVAPRRAFDRLNRSRSFAPVDALEVWSINCFIVAKKHRRQGLLRRLLGDAVRFARARGAAWAEGYPVDRQGKPGSADLYPGTLAAFRDQGFSEVARRLPTRPIVRRMLD